MKNILVAVRATKECMKVVEYAATLSRLFNTRLHVLDVVHNPFNYQGWNLPMTDLDGEYRRLLKKIREDLHRLVQQEEKKGLLVESLVREGEPASVIAQVVEEKKIGLLVMPSHPEDRIEHFLFGRANERLIRKMPCSILLMKEGLYDSCE